MHLSKVCCCVILLLTFAAVAQAAQPLSRTGEGPVVSSPADLSSGPPPYRPASGRQTILFVEDPGNAGFGPAVKPDTVWDVVLAQAVGGGNYAWFGPTTDPAENGPPASEMANHCMVIWNCYDFWWSDQALTPTDQTEIATYLGGGGKLWLIGHDVVWSGVPFSWLSTWFHLAGVNEDYASGEPSLDVHGLAEINCISLNITSDYQSNDFYPDELDPDGAAHPVLEDIGFGGLVNGIFYPGVDFMSSFWAVDCRTPDPWGNWVDMVTLMIEAFGCLPGVEEESSVAAPTSFDLQASPNPVRGHSVISYALPLTDQTSLKIYDVTGALVCTLVDEVQGPGTHNVNWDGKDSNGSKLTSGIYLYRLESGTSVATKKLVVVR